jgi:hypothetical protein
LNSKGSPSPFMGVVSTFLTISIVKTSSDYLDA